MGIENCRILGIENCRVLGTESGRVGPLSRGGSPAPPTRERGRLVQCCLGTARPFFSNATRPAIHQGSAWAGFRRSRRQGWPGCTNRRETERNATAVHAGETPALPGGVSLPQCSRHSLALLLQPDSTGNHARALPGPGPWGSRRQGGRVGRIAGKLSETQRQCMRARRPRSRVGRLFRSVPGTAWPFFLQRDSTGSRARALLWPGSRRFCRRGWRVHHRRRSARYAAAVHAGETPALPGGASLPQCSRHSLALPSNPTRPAIAPGLCLGRTRGVPAGRVAGGRIAGKLSETQRECMRAGRPRSRVGLHCVTSSRQRRSVFILARPAAVPLPVVLDSPRC